MMVDLVLLRREPMLAAVEEEDGAVRCVDDRQE